ncbi:MAG: MMPL family transporter [Marinobacter sp.]|nr:MMPL family transporter [Marinobacter sp.]
MRLFAQFYQRTVLAHPLLTLLAFAVVMLLAATQFSQFRLDASAESLVLENDQSLEDYRQMNQRFTASDGFLVVTYAPFTDLFSDDAIATLRSLRDDLAAVRGVSSTNSILNVPLLHSPRMSLSTVEEELLTLDQHDVPLADVRRALLDNPLYPDLLISRDATTTAIQVNLPTPDNYFTLLYQRDGLRNKAREQGLSADEQQTLARVSAEFQALLEAMDAEQARIIREVRGILAQYRDRAEIHLGGVPMIASDMIDFVRNDISTFGVGVLIFIVLTLAFIFREWRWVVAPLLVCLFTVWLMVGYLGWMQWPVTVISSNFVSLLLIMTMSITIHLIVRYREFQHDEPDAPPLDTNWRTVKSMIKPCFYMAITTIVAFGSLTFSGIRPVIDFGWMMTIGIALAFLMAFVVFPALLALLPPPRHERSADEGHAITRHFAVLTERYGNGVLVVSLVLAVIWGVGLSRLTVENSFIDYFKSNTEIHQGMIVIDNKLGGTTPLDIVITDNRTAQDADPFLDECDPFLDDECEEEDNRNTWFTWQKVNQLEQVHNYLNELPESGKVMSVTTTLRLLAQVNGGTPLNAFQLPFIPAMVPDELADLLITPYINDDTGQARFNVRLLESSPDLKRQELLERIQTALVEDLGFSEDQILLTGMTVMYNNMLQSLFDSQIKTLGVVFVAIMVMFLILFRSLLLAVIGILPNLLAAASVLGLLGLLGIPLDMMSITIAAITVGIAVDDTIHYMHRFRVEFARDGDYLATMHRCHSTIGRAMFYTSLTIITGFSILVLSNFIPTIYFGLFTGFAMLMALLGALTLLPRLIILLKPFGPDNVPQPTT